MASKFDNRLKEFGERWEVDRYLSATGYLHQNVKPFFCALPKVRAAGICPGLKPQALKHITFYKRGSSASLPAWWRRPQPIVLWRPICSGYSSHGVWIEGHPFVRLPNSAEHRCLLQSHRCPIC